MKHSKIHGRHLLLMVHALSSAQESNQSTQPPEGAIRFNDKLSDRNNKQLIHRKALSQTIAHLKACSKFRKNSCNTKYRFYSTGLGGETQKQSRMTYTA